MNYTNLLAETRALTDTDSTSYTTADITRRINAGLEDIVSTILNSDGTWSFDDTNYTDLPVGTTTLVNNQQDYTFDISHLEIERVEVKDIDGIWSLLTPIDKSNIDVAMPEFEKTAGVPTYYDKQGSSLFLYPAPDTTKVTATAGLKVYFKRTADLFLVTDTTKVPGFASPFHIILAYMAALPHCVSFKKDRVAIYEKKIMDMKKEIVKFYSRREKDMRKKITTKPICFR